MALVNACLAINGGSGGTIADDNFSTIYNGINSNHDWTDGSYSVTFPSCTVTQVNCWGSLNLYPYDGRCEGYFYVGLLLNGSWVNIWSSGWGRTTMAAPSVITPASPGDWANATGARYSYSWIVTDTSSGGPYLNEIQAWANKGGSFGYLI